MKAKTIFEAIRKYGTDWFQPVRMPQPTQVRPGPDKVAIFRARLEAGEALFHPDDAYSKPEKYRSVSLPSRVLGLRVATEAMQRSRGDDDEEGGAAIEQRFRGRGHEFPGPVGGRFRDRG